MLRMKAVWLPCIILFTGIVGVIWLLIEGRISDAVGLIVGVGTLLLAFFSYINIKETKEREERESLSKKARILKNEIFDGLHSN